MPDRPRSNLYSGLISVAFVLLAGAVTQLASGPEPEAPRAVLVVPALLIVPGLGWARGAAHPVDRVLRAAAIGAAMSVPLLLLCRSGWVFALAAGVAALGWRTSLPSATTLSVGERIGVHSVLIATVAVTLSWWPTVTRPLDGHWWSAAGEELAEEGAACNPGVGWTTQRQAGRGWVLGVPHDGTGEGEATIEMGHGILALRGEGGATMTVAGNVARVETDPVEKEEEGAVPRYLGRGVAALEVEEGGTVRFKSAYGSTLYVIPDAGTLWELHGSGELRFVHYYQILNMVEQLRWGRELGGSRWVTDVQPPLWSWILGTATVGNDKHWNRASIDEPMSEQPTANVLFLYICALIGLAGVRVIGRWAPDAPWVAWCLPALGLAVHAKLMLEPGSTGMPDSAFTLAILGLAASAPGGGSFGWGLASQLLRYPGTLVSGLILGLSGRLSDLSRLMASVVVALIGFGAAGWATGSLDQWITTASWETGPEHWHGETSPAVLLGRAPEFYDMWLGYAGAAPLIALTGWNRAVRVLLGTAVLYSLLLCTIDHFPSHYFLPLVQLSVLAAACARPGRWAWRAWLSALGLIYSLWWIPITG